MEDQNVGCGVGAPASDLNMKNPAVVMRLCAAAKALLLTLNSLTTARSFLDIQPNGFTVS